MAPHRKVEYAFSRRTSVGEARKVFVEAKAPGGTSFVWGSEPERLFKNIADPEKPLQVQVSPCENNPLKRYRYNDNTWNPD